MASEPATPELPSASAPVSRARTPASRATSASSLKRSPSGPGRPQTASGMGLARYASTGSRSTFGTQVLGGRDSAPSFSFGSAPARIALSAGTQRKLSELQPSVAATSTKTPGPIYDAKPTRKWLGDGPRHGFGTETQRPPPRTGLDISKTTGKSTTPGPGTYPLHGAMGPQPLAGTRGNPMYSFGQAKQRVPPGSTTSDPGPVYDVPASATARGIVIRATYSFGTEVRDRVHKPDRVPGPGQYKIPNALGPQFHSQHKSGAVVGFGVPSGKGEVGRPLMLEGAASPGPKYSHDSSHGKQHLSGRRTQPVMRFPRAQRFSVDDLAGAYTPGPGQYLI